MTSILSPLSRRLFRTASLIMLTLGAAPLLYPADDLRPAERTFLEKAAESSRQQLRLADVGTAQAGSSDIRTHAQQVTTDYRSLSDALDALIRRKGGLAGAPVGGTSETYRQLSAKSGSDFDRDFVRISSELSDSVMALFERAANDAKDPDIREFAAAQIPVLREHTNRLAELKKTYQ